MNQPTSSGSSSVPERPIPPKLEEKLAAATREELAALVLDLYRSLMDARHPRSFASETCYYCGIPTSMSPSLTTSPRYPGTEVIWPSCCLTCSELEFAEAIPVAECSEELRKKAEQHRVDNPFDREAKRT